MDWCPIHGVFPLHAQCSRGRLRIHLDPDKDKWLVRDEWMNKWKQQANKTKSLSEVNEWTNGKTASK